MTPTKLPKTKHGKQRKSGAQETQNNCVFFVAKKVTWQPGLNFTGVVTSPQELFAALLSYAVVTAVLPVRGLFETLPEARTLVNLSGKVIMQLV